MRRHAVALVALCLPACTVRYVAPPPAPPMVGSLRAPPRAPSAEEGTVTLEADRRSRVELITGRQEIDPNLDAWGVGGRQWSPAPLAGHLTLRPLCQTPCAVNLPRGDHEVLFSDVDPSTGRTSIASVRVGERPSLLRHSLGRQTHDVGGVIGAVILGGLGASALALGGMFMAFGTSDDGTDLRPAGGVSLGIGAALGISSVIVGLISRPTRQLGATTQWTP